MLQCLAKRGIIDSSKTVDSYNAKTYKTDEFGQLLPDTCLYDLTKNLPDFLNEETLLQHHAKRMGVILDRSPKCHPEIAGEGIEYCWALAKIFYRNAPIKLKRGKDSFRDLVKKSTDPTGVLSIEKVRSCSRRAREYMILY